MPHYPERHASLNFNNYAQFIVESIYLVGNSFLAVFSKKHWTPYLLRSGFSNLNLVA